VTYLRKRRPACTDQAVTTSPKLGAAMHSPVGQRNIREYKWNETRELKRYLGRSGAKAALVLLPIWRCSGSKPNSLLELRCMVITDSLRSRSALFILIGVALCDT